MTHLITEALCAANEREIFTLFSHAAPIVVHCGLLLDEAGKLSFIISLLVSQKVVCKYNTQ